MQVIIEFLRDVTLQELTTIHSDLQRLERKTLDYKPSKRIITVLDKWYNIVDFTDDETQISLPIYRMGQVPPYGEAYYETPSNDENRL